MTKTSQKEDDAMSALVSFMKQELIYEGTATELCERLGLNIGANNLRSKLSKYKNLLQKLGVDKPTTKPSTAKPSRTLNRSTTDSGI